jgi:antitoxin component of MazEF toxin-antitoxin module
MDMGLVQRRIEMLEKFEEEIRIAKEALKAELGNDVAYQEASAVAKEAMLAKKQARDVVFAQENNQKILQTIKDNTEETNTLKEILAQELMEHYQENGTNEIDDGSGEARKFVLSVKLLPKRGKKY